MAVGEATIVVGTLDSTAVAAGEATMVAGVSASTPVVAGAPLALGEVPAAVAVSVFRGGVADSPHPDKRATKARVTQAVAAARRFPR